MSAQISLTMDAVGLPGFEEQCAGCFRKFRRGERMTAVEYDDDSQAGWHCEECIASWKEKGEASLPRWAADESAKSEPNAEG
jgi:hypothetical protein